MSTRNPMKDQVAIVGLGASPYGRDLHRTASSLALEASVKAIRDAGLSKEDIDGLCGYGFGFGSFPGGFMDVHEGLGIGPRLTWVTNSWLGAGLLETAHAVYSGACDVALVVMTYLRDTRSSVSARNDPYRVRTARTGGRGWLEGGSRGTPGAALGTGVYAQWGARYMHEFGAPREVFGMIAVNNRTNAVRNPNALLREPITMDDYLGARVIREPLGLLDMDVPVDASEALIVTTAERARDMVDHPVYVHAATYGEAGYGVHSYDNGRSWTETAPWVAMRSVWPKSDVTSDDLDLFFPYDGFTPNAIAFTEAAGFCGPGEAYDFLQSNWDKEENRLRLNGKTYVSSNGGSCSHGRMGGFNYYGEAAAQLRGSAGERQIRGARTALIGIGSFYHDPTAVVLRAD
jgi:acetyl-CoA acetyltransferase